VLAQKKEFYLLAKSRERVSKERAIRRRQLKIALADRKMRTLGSDQGRLDWLSLARGPARHQLVAWPGFIHDFVCRFRTCYINVSGVELVAAMRFPQHGEI
jgi:hypothetical protein